MKSFVITVFSGMFLLISGQALAGDIEAGKKKATEVCAACHGLDGNSPNPAFPKLAGQYETYLEKTLIAYKTGERENAIMGGMAAALSKEDIENLSVYYSSQSGLATKK